MNTQSVSNIPFCRRVPHTHSLSHMARTHVTWLICEFRSHWPWLPSLVPMHKCSAYSHRSFLFFIFDEPNSSHAYCRKINKKSGLSIVAQAQDREEMAPFRICIPHANAILSHPKLPISTINHAGWSVYPLPYFSSSTPKSKLQFQACSFSFFERSRVSLSTLPSTRPAQSIPMQKIPNPQRTPTHRNATRFSLELGEFNPPAEGGGKEKGRKCKKKKSIRSRLCGSGYLTISIFFFPLYLFVYVHAHAQSLCSALALKRHTGDGEVVLLEGCEGWKCGWGCLRRMIFLTYRLNDKLTGW